MYDTSAGMPTEGNEFAQLIEHLRKAQENAAMLGHLAEDKSKLVSNGWLAVAEMLRRTQYQVTILATKRMM